MQHSHFTCHSTPQRVPEKCCHNTAGCCENQLWHIGTLIPSVCPLLSLDLNPAWSHCFRKALFLHVTAAELQESSSLAWSPWGAAWSTSLSLSTPRLPLQGLSRSRGAASAELPPLREAALAIWSHQVPKTQQSGSGWTSCPGLCHMGHFVMAHTSPTGGFPSYVLQVQKIPYFYL